MSNKFKHGSKHHIVPASRGGKKIPENEIELDPEVHTAWHTLFGNLLPEEVIILIKYWTTKNGKINRKFLRGKKRQKAWKIIFGEINPDQAIKIVEKQFSRESLNKALFSFIMKICIMKIWP